MKVSELIELLETADQDAEVFVDGYEGGIQSLDSEFQVYQAKVVKDYHKDSGYYGDHELLSEIYSMDEDEVKTIEGVMISRNGESN